MYKKEANLTTIAIVQQLDECYWYWEDTSPVKKTKEGNCKHLLEEIIRRLEENDIQVKECYGIIHDKDKRTIWDEKQMKNVIEDKEIHIHVLLKFVKGASLEKIAVSVGVESQYLQKLKSGRYGYDNSLSYLVHAKDDKKYKYSPKDVVTLKGEDYESIYNRRISTWLKGKAKKETLETKESIDWLILEILNGNITKSNIILNDEYYVIYGQHKRRINEAFDTFYEKKALKTINDLENGKFKKTVIFIQGRSGIGKTKFSKKIAGLIKLLSQYFTERPWEVCITASKNAFDEYNTQEILLLDDIRGNSLNVSDWLKLLDPYSISPISARYHNKQSVAQIIIITSPHSPDDFFRNIENSSMEDFDQFYRRIDINLRIDDFFYLSNSYKKEETKEANKGINQTSSNTKKHYYTFSNEKKCNMKQAIKVIINKITRNMQWTKIDYPPTDQSKKDNPKIK